MDFTFINQGFQATEIIDWLNLAVLALTFLAIVWYTIETVRLRKINKKLLEIQEENLKPKIQVYFDNGNSFHTILLKVTNIGGSPAYNVKVKIEPQLNLGWKVMEKYFEKNTIFQNGVSILLPGKEYVIIAGDTQNASNNYKAGNLPHDYNFNVEYNDKDGHKFSSQMSQNIDLFFNRIGPSDRTELEEQIHSLNKNSEELVKAVKNLNNRETEQFVFHTGQSFNVESQILQFEFLEGTLFAENINNESIIWQIELQCYITPLKDVRSVIPFYHCKAFLNQFSNVPFEKRPGVEQFPIYFVPPHQTFYRSKTLYATNSELIIDGPGYITLVVWTASKVFEINDTPVVTADIVLKTINIDVSINLKAQFLSRSPIRGKTREWILQAGNSNT
ncbi:hypothetical protein HUU42_07550 [bacterium]|nr:hypothetical protein [bacterium]